MIDDKDIFIQSNARITDALIQLTKTKKKHLICVDRTDQLIGTLTDGDIRRALIDGCNPSESVLCAVNKKPVFVTEQATKEEVEKFLSVRIRIIPVVDAENKVIGYHSFNELNNQLPANNKSITILGMGYVGLTLGIILADSGFRTYGYDVNDILIKKLQNAAIPFFENGLQRLLDLHANKTLKFSSSLNSIKADVYIITVGTPLNKESKMPDIGYIEKAAAAIGSILESGNLVILRSTVPIGCTRDIVLPILEKESGLLCGKDFYLTFAPERTVEGAALAELRKNPQIIGAYDQTSFSITSQIFNKVTHTVIDVGSLEAAEMAKLMDNTFRDCIFAYANNIAMLAEKMNLNIHQITEAVNFGYSRNMIPKPSPGVGGPCLSKDPYILKNTMERYGVNTEFISSIRHINEHGPLILKHKLNNLLVKAGKDLKSVKKISLIGLAMKGAPETSDLRDSTSLWFLDCLPTKNNVFGYDPVVSPNDINGLGITPVTLQEAFQEADAVVILNNHRSYSNWNLHELLNTMNKIAVVIDSWNNIEPLYFKQQTGILYGGLGCA